MTAAEVRSIRAELDLTQQELAQLVGVDTRSVVRWEAQKAEPSGSSLELLRVYKWVSSHPKRAARFQSLLADCPSRTLGELMTFLLRAAAS